MPPNPALGVFLHAVGGFAAGTFYVPLKQVRQWAWESFWLVMGLAAWLVTPWLVAWLTTPRLFDALLASPSSAVLPAITFGALWGVGNLTFGLSVRYLGMALGFAAALGFCMAFGTLVPPLFRGVFGSPADREALLALFTTLSGLIVLGGVAVCLAGIALCGLAGMSKESELSTEQKRATVAEFALTRGFLVAACSGILSACFAFGLAAGKPIAEVARSMGTSDVFSNNIVLVVILIGGFASNAIWCISLNLRKGTFRDYLRGPPGRQFLNYGLSLAAGVIWYGQFFFYGMGTTKLGPDYDFSSWSIHMAFIIIFSNLWGMYFREWHGTSRRTRIAVWLGISTLMASTVIIGYGNYLAAAG